MKIDIETLRTIVKEEVAAAARRPAGQSRPGAAEVARSIAVEMGGSPEDYMHAARVLLTHVGGGDPAAAQAELTAALAPEAAGAAEAARALVARWVG